MDRLLLVFVASLTVIRLKGFVQFKTLYTDEISVRMLDLLERMKYIRNEYTTDA